MRCYICDGEMRNVKKDVETTWKGRTILFRGIDVWVCGSRGEEAYEPDDVRLMQGLVQGMLHRPEYQEVMNVEEVADLLRVTNQTVYKLVRSGRLPATKIGREWRFSRAKILEILEGEATGDGGTARVAARGAGGEVSASDAAIINRHLAEMGQ
ncbi:MAG: helix-turn-helix domain-containing protein [Desulfotomaculales bacterium]